LSLLKDVANQLQFLKTVADGEITEKLNEDIAIGK